MARVRHPAVSGRFYPDDANELREVVSRCIESGMGKSDGPAPKAVIVPHAGYVYSGPIAGSAYARLAPDRGIIERIVLLGPSHRVPFLGLAAPSDDAFETPLGSIPVDRASIDAIATLPQVIPFDRAHDFEHSLEVQLPFLQVVLERFALVPLAVGDATPEEIAEVLEKLWGGPETRIVVSSDLSHYLDYDSATRRDRATSDAIEALRVDRISTGDACGCYPIRGLLAVAQSRGLAGATIDLRNSGDTAGPRDQVVGYGAYVFG